MLQCRHMSYDYLNVIHLFYSGTQYCSTLLEKNGLEADRFIFILKFYYHLSHNCDSHSLLSLNDMCCSCWSEEEEETIFHFMCHCPAFGIKRRRFLGFLSLFLFFNIQSAAIGKFILFSFVYGMFDPRIGC